MVEKTRLAASTWRQALFDGLLRDIRVRDSVYFRLELQADWGFGLTKDCAMFHIVDQGECWLQVNGTDSPLHLSEGNFVVLTNGQPHSLRDQITTPVVDFFELVGRQVSENTGILRFGGNGPLTKLVCGGIEFENRYSSPILAVLPPLLQFSRRSYMSSGAMRARSC